MPKQIYAILIGLFLIQTYSNSKAQVVINEYSAANLKQYADIYGKFEDWIELYNNSNATINIGGYRLSDDSLELNKYILPASVSIPAYGFVQVWCSGRNLNASSSNMHASFKLTQTKNNNEVVYLTNSSNQILDFVKIKKTKVHQSRGRKLDADTNWVIFTNPTKKASNNAATSYSAFANKPTVNVAPGFYYNSFAVTITNNEPTSTLMYYTLDGTEPSEASTLYSGPITINATTVLKAIAISNNFDILPSFIEFDTYFMNVSHTIPVVSIAGTELDVLANGDNSLRPYGSIEYFNAAKVRKAQSYGEYNSHGQDSWANSHRSIDFVARDEMGYSKEIKEKLFALSSRDKFQRIILRAAGDDNYPADHSTSNKGSAHLRDAYFQNLCRQGGMSLDTRTATKAIVYLNGQYWGVYDLREIPDDHDYTDYYYGQDKYSLQYILTWGNTWAQYGGTTAINKWGTLRNYIFNNDLSDQSKFDYVASQLDVASLSDYVISHTMSVSSDWLNYNTGWWRGLDPTGGHQKWGYILWDNDASFAFYINYTGIPDTSASAEVCGIEGNPNVQDPEQHLKILERLRMNAGFNTWFINRYADLMNTVFSCENMLHQLDSITNVIAPEMYAQCTRWNGTYSEWQQNVAKLRYFVERRCGAKADNGMTSCYNLTGPYDVSFDVYPAGAGSLKVNSLTPPLPFKASYFGNIDLNINTQSSNILDYEFQNWLISNNTLTAGNNTALNSTQISAGDSLVANYAIVTGLSNENISRTSFDAFPTLVKDNLQINMQLVKNEITKVSIVDMLGKDVLTADEKQMSKGRYSSNLEVKKLGLAPGVYLVNFTAGNYNKSIKFVYQP